ncbi:hypothetical protein BJ741DRAFT_680740 [Chytriomyces cf. hyalinus JEL632]|nr:hypothetical protein BJ741DRAFT_680740 [Chytriomyces cf. hyalinus JEL632]
MSKRSQRCTRCIAHHKKCDAEPGGCTRCQQTNSVCTYRQVKSVQLSCVRCCSLHKRCDHRREPGCARCKRAGVACVYLTTQSDSQAAKPAFDSVSEVSNSDSDSIQRSFYAPSPAVVSSPTSSMQSSLSPDVNKPNPFSFSVIPTTTSVSSSHSTNSFPTFSEWSLVYSYFNSTNQRAQESIAFSMLDRKHFLSTFFAQPSALWLIVCAYATCHTNTSSPDIFKAYEYYHRACMELSEEAKSGRSFKIMQAAMLISQFALLMMDHEESEKYACVARSIFLSVDCVLDVPSMEYEQTLCHLSI